MIDRILHALSRPLSLGRSEDLCSNPAPESVTIKGNTAVIRRPGVQGLIEWGTGRELADYLDYQGDHALAETLIVRHPREIVGYIHEVEVDPANRRRGLGSVAVRQLLDAAADHGARRVYLHAQPLDAATGENALEAFYLRLGFREEPGHEEDLKPVYVIDLARRPNPSDDVIEASLDDDWMPRADFAGQVSVAINDGQDYAVARIGTPEALAEYLRSLDIYNNLASKVVHKKTIGAYFESVEVDESRRREGTGKRLVVAVLDELRSLGAKWVVLHASPDRTTSADVLDRFYRGLGFKPWPEAEEEMVVHWPVYYLDLTSKARRGSR